MVSVKQCHYEVLGLPCDCTADKIRSAYRRLALQRHPDKLVQSGLSQSDATAQFQELQHAYEVLSDPKERAWYDSHRSQILFSFRNSVVPDLFSNTVFSGYSDSGKGFYKVYSDEFDKIHANEINFAKKLGIGVDVVRQAPVMGNLDSPYAQVTAFYSYWLGFSTVMDFCWVDEYDVMAVPDLKSRQLMEEENNKVRSKVRKEYNDSVRKLADFVKKRDKRVIDMKVKKSVEKQKKKEERERKKMLVKERKESAMAYEESLWAKVEEEWFGAKVYEEPEWAKVAEEWFGTGAKVYEEPEWARVAEEWFGIGANVYEEPEWAAKVAEEWFGAKVYEEPEWAKVAEEWFGTGAKVEEKKAEKEFYCVLCEKKFKSEKQWKKHELSKKHKVSVDSAPGSSNVHEEAEGHSIYIRNLPFNATVGQLEEVFKKFGPIKHGGIQVRSSKHGFCFGFVKFEELSSMHSALEASPITVGERQAVVEEKRTTTRVSGSGRGRYPSGRGSFRSESFRGRGKFGGEMDSEIKGNSQGGTRSSQQPNQNRGGRRGHQGAGNRNSTQSTSGRSYCSTKEGKTKTEKTK